MRLTLERVGKRYGPQPVLQDVNLTVSPGDLVLVRGPSGAGKTTLTRIVGLLEPPSEGRVLVDDRDVTDLSDKERAHLRRDLVGHVFQAHNMIPSLTLLENVVLPMRLRGKPDEARARTLLADVGLGEKTDALPGEVSIGQRQRAAFARALANDPAILLADEPTASLDAENAAAVVDRLRGLATEGRAVVVASHDARVWEMMEGAVVWEVSEGRVRLEKADAVA